MSTTYSFGLEDGIALPNPYGDDNGDDNDGGLPALNYTMTPARKRSLYISVAFIVFSNVALSSFVFFVAKYVPSPRLDPSAYLGFASAALGIFQIPQWPFRYWNLCRQNGRRSCLPPDDPAQAPRTLSSRVAWVFLRADAFQWGFLIGIVVGAALLTIGSSINDTEGYYPLIVAMPALIFGCIGLVGLIVTALSSLPSSSKLARLPFRLSNVPAGEPIRPVLYFLWCDLVGCDGGGGLVFRSAFDRRYRLSPHFRAMLTEISYGLSISLLGLAAAACALTFTLYYADDGNVRHYEDASWAANMAMLLLWLAVTAFVAIRHAFKRLRAEKLWWTMSRQRSHRSASGPVSVPLVQPPKPASRGSDSTAVDNKSQSDVFS
ncbi:hypothetical protein OC834_005813 [Tilletia horrida]|nr:hypothetical protein OC834_005813 [Tilletia horrida]